MTARRDVLGSRRLGFCSLEVLCLFGSKIWIVLEKGRETGGSHHRRAGAAQVGFEPCLEGVVYGLLYVRNTGHAADEEGVA